MGRFSGDLHLGPDVCCDEIVQPTQQLLQRTSDALLGNDRVRQIGAVEPDELNVCTRNESQRIICQREHPDHCGLAVGSDQPERGELLDQIAVVLLENLGGYRVGQVVPAEPLEVQVAELRPGHRMNVERQVRRAPSLR
ncbi:MAG TPA: hypothetical protein VFT22_12355 [Kofleriaceae bacterium]|nr:hypothetical protein [Kofleriaceae bacterium]